MPLLPRTLLCLNEAFIRVDGRLHTTGVWWRFARRLAAHCQSLTLYVPMEDRADAGGLPVADWAVESAVGRPYYVRIQQFYRGLPLTWRMQTRLANKLCDSHELIIARMPDPAAVIVARAAARRGRPMALLIGGDVAVGSIATETRNPFVRPVAALLANRLRRQEEWVARRCRFVGLWDSGMLPRFRPLCPAVERCQSPNISLGDVFERADTCQSKPIRLLRVCQLSPVKAVDVLLEALKRLRDAGRDVMLDIAGGDLQPGTMAHLRAQAERSGMADRVNFLGNIEFGPALFELYRRSDIHIISSTWEGLPRCLAEARASCCPTVATAVGSLPNVIRDGVDGLLTPAGDAAAMADAIARLIDDGELRRTIIREGFARVPESTAEFHAERLARLIAGASGFTSRNGEDQLSATGATAV